MKVYNNNSFIPSLFLCIITRMFHQVHGMEDPKLLRGGSITTSSLTTATTLPVDDETTSSLSRRRSLFNNLDAVMSSLFDPYSLAGSETNQNDAETFDSFERIVTGPFEGPLIPILNGDPVTPAKQDRVIGGRDVVGDKKHYALLLYQDAEENWKWAGCGATLVSACHVVTAAHCMVDNGFTIAGVYTNAIAPYHDNNQKPFHFSLVAEKWIHPNFDDFNNLADIAILKLQTCASPQEYPYATPATPSYRISGGTTTEINGFGYMTQERETLPDVLQQATVPYIPRQDCRDQYYGNDVLDDMLCAGYEQGGIDACLGDSGSGLVRNEGNGHVTFLGLVSWGVGCGSAGSPAVYTDVSYYFDWLQDNVCHDATAQASWCDPRTVGYNNANNNANINRGGNNNSGGNNNNNNNNINNFCFIQGTSCRRNIDCCSGICETGSTCR